MRQFFSLVSILLLCTSHVCGQCLPDAALRRHITYLRDSSKLSYKEQLADLLPYVQRMNNCPGDSTHVLLLRRIGGLYYYQSDFLKALQYYQLSANMIRGNTGKAAVNPKDLINIYFWIAVQYDSLNNTGAKMKAIDSCIDIALQLHAASSIACIRALYARVEYFFDVGDYHRCVQDAAMCEKLAWEYAKTGTTLDYKTGAGHAASSLGWQIIALERLGNFEEAERILRNKPEQYKNKGFRNYMGMIYGQLAEVQLHKQNYEKALLFFNLELTYEKKAGYDFNCKQTLNEIGYEIYFSRYHNADKALAYYRNALRIVNKEEAFTKEDAIESLNIFTHIADVYVQKGDYATADLFFQKAFDQVKPGIGETGILQISSAVFPGLKKLNYLSDLLIDKGDAYLQKFRATHQTADIMEAIRVYKASDQLLDRIKTEQSDVDSKLFWRNDTRRLYEHAIEACYQAGNTKDAFYFFEKSRAVLLNDRLNEQQLLAGNDIMKQTQARKTILQWQQELGLTDTASAQFSEIQTSIFAKQHELDQLQEGIKETNPLYYQSFFDSSRISLTDVRSGILHDHQALVEMYEGDSALYSMVITEGNQSIARINKKSFDSSANLYIHYISDFNLLNQHFESFVQVSAGLYRLIFQNNPLPAGRIIISPQGHYFPFECLVTDINAGGPNPVYFLSNHAVSYTYSARYLLNSFASAPGASPGTLMGVAPVSFKVHPDLSTLSGSDLSLEQIASYMQGEKNMLYANASRNNFLLQFPRYRIIQLYTHASDSSARKEPVIYFADSALYLSELELIYGKKPFTQLIVLSACETGTGRLYQGEGVFSFNRGFAALGIPSCITNLWSIDNESTYRLTELFYKYLARGLPIDLALQRAKLEFFNTATRQNQLPYYWAAAILVGKTNPVAISGPFKWGYLVMIILGVAGCFMGWRFWGNSPIFKKSSYGKQDPL